LATQIPDPASDGATFVDGPPSNGHRRRLRLDSVDRIRYELGKLYHEARDGDRDTTDFGRLANGLAIMARLLEGGELRQRVEVIEQKLLELAGP